MSRRPDCQNDKGQNTDDRTDIVVLLVDRQLVKPRHPESSSLSRRRSEVGDGVSTGKQIDDVKVVDVSGEDHDQVRRCDVKRIRQRELEKDLHRVRTVHICRLVELARDILEHTRQLEQGIRNVHPDIYNDDGHSRPGRIGKERKARVLRDPAEISQKHVDRVVFCLEHRAHDQQGDKHRDRAGEHETESPEALCPRVLAVDDDR